MCNWRWPCRPGIGQYASEFAAGPPVCVREVERRSAHAAGQSKANEGRHMSRWCCRSRCSAGPTATCQTNVDISSQTDCSNLGRVGCGRDVCCRQRPGFEDKRGHPVCAARFLVISRWHLARRAGGHPHVPGVWIELMAVKPLWHKRTARRSTVAAESYWLSLTPRPGVAQVSFPHA
jgi:hypothetical protein